MQTKTNPGNRPLVIAYLGFIILGLPGAALGVAWPSIRATFGLSQDAQGILVAAIMVGSLITSFSSGRVITWLGTGYFVLGGATFAMLGILGIALAPSWWLAVAGGAIMGLGTGAINAGLNTYIAQRYSAGRLNWLHASYGLGSTLGPFLMTTVIENAGGPWQAGYLIIALCWGGLAASFALTLSLWQRGALSKNPAGDSSHSDQRVRFRDTLKLPAVWIGIALFVAFTGAQAGASNWAYSLFTEARSVDEVLAGRWASIYWGCLMVGRIALGFVIDRLGVRLVLRLSTLGAMLGALLIWGNLSEALSFIGLAVMGFSLASLYPTLVAETPHRVGQEHAPNAIGFQLAASSLGSALLASGLAGLLAENVGLEAIGPFLLVCSGIAFAFNELGLRHRPAAAGS